jgi:hypothetical protein
MSTQEYIRSITAMTSDDFPTLTPLPQVNGTSTSSTSFFANISWQTWLIIILILMLLGINIFAYLAKGTEESVSVFKKVFGPILTFFGFSTLEITKQMVETSAAGTKAGVDMVADATTGAINVIEETARKGASIPTPTSGTYVGVSTSQGVQGQQSKTSLPVQNRIQQAGSNSNSNIDELQQGSLEKALQDSSSKQQGPLPSDSSSSLQTTGKAGWCFIGEEQGLRTCSEIGVNDVCMSGDVFPNQTICMNPNLRA